MNKLNYKREPVRSRRNEKQPDTIRLNKYISNSGICSRREADKYISSGLVSVNNKIVTELGTKISNNDVVKFNNETLRQEKKIYILMNKPKDFITTTKDPYAKKIVTDLLKNAVHQRVFPVGRLDRNTTGVLLLTNDGELAKKLTHPGYNKKKIYHITLSKNVKAPDMQSILKGINLDDVFIKADAIDYVDSNDKSQIGIEIHSGQNRIVRRLFEHFDYKVKKLDRVYFAGLTKKGLSRGRWRFLTDQEISMLKIGAYE